MANVRIALDGMGGDDAPAAMVAGAVDYVQANPDHTVVLVGIEDRLNALLQEHGGGWPRERIEVHHAPEVVGMDAKIEALKEFPENSISVAARLVKSGEADAMVLCGNTACSVAAAQLNLRRIPGVLRAGILTPMPTVQEGKWTWVVDCGANAVGKPEHLVQWGQLACAYLQGEGNDRPSVGILSIGSEDGKGDELTQKTAELVRATDVNYHGLIEGNDIFKATVDVVLCDGFTGNIMLKTAEGTAAMVGDVLKEEYKRSPLRMLGGLLSRGVFGRLRARTHWSLVGGCPLVGVDGITIIAHGRSDRVAVKNALRQAAGSIEHGTLDRLRAAVERKKA
jgi:glycerol-3-phosphate acyltransferase PlsX